MIASQKKCFLLAMSQEKIASVQSLSLLRDTRPKELLAQLTCSEFLNMVDRLKKSAGSGFPGRT